MANAIRQEGKAMVVNNQIPWLQIDDRIWIALEGSEEKEGSRYLSRVKKIASGDVIIELMNDDGLRPPIKSGDLILITVNFQGWVYSFNAHVLDRKQGQKPTLKVQPTGPYRKIQRRNYVRIATMIDISAIEILPEIDQTDPLSIDTKTINLSGGGFAICHTAPLPIGTLFQVTLAIPEESPLELQAKVVRCTSLAPIEGFSHYEIGFAFSSLSEVSRRRIMRHLIWLQQQLLSIDPKMQA
jgi:c-di-GMP-binding flagellar brake protein YcgR